MPAPTKPLTVEVPGQGTFLFRVRTFRDEIRIQAEAVRMLGGEDVASPLLRNFANLYATITVLLVQAPAGVVLEDLDPLDDASYGLLEEVFSALLAAEQSFRGKDRARDQEPGPGAGEAP